MPNALSTLLCTGQVSTRAHTHTHTLGYSQLVVIDIIEDADIHQTTGQLIFIVS